MSAQAIIDSIDAADAFFASQQGLVSPDAYVQSQDALAMSLQLQLTNIVRIDPADATVMNNRIASSLFGDTFKQRLLAILSSKVGGTAQAQTARVQIIDNPLVYPMRFAPPGSTR